MQLPGFTYLRPTSLQEAINALDNETAVMAGGSDLLVNMKLGLVTPARIVSLARIEALRDLSFSPDSGLRIGAGCQLSALAGDTDISTHYPALSAAIRAVGSRHVRNVATLGGNLCLPTRCWFTNQSEQWRASRQACFKTDGELCHVIKTSARCHALNSSDTAPALIALGASVRLAGPQGERSLPLADFYHDDGVDYLALGEQEILTSVDVPPPAGKAVFLKVAQREGLDYAAGSLAGWRHAGQLRLVVGSIASLPRQLHRAAAVITEQGFGAEAIAAAADRAREDLGEVSNLFSPPGYKRRLVRSMLRRVLTELADSE